MKKFIAGLVVAMFVLINGGVVFADDVIGGTILPDARVSGEAYTEAECIELFQNSFLDQETIDFVKQSIAEDREYANVYLGCGIKTGDIHMWMIPYYIRYILEFLMGIAGIVSVGGVVYGGFVYIFAGVSQEKDKGKTALIYSVVGLILTMVAWALVNVVVGFVTG